MIEERKYKRKYSENNPANAEYHIPLIKIRNAIKYYIQSQPNLYKYYNFSLPAQQHDLDLILDQCIERVKYGYTYRSSKLLPKSTFNDAYQNLQKRNILKKTYIELLEQYFIKGPNRKLLYRYKDSTCVVNKNGSENVKYNKYKKRKVTNVSTETDSNTIVIHSTINDGNMHDSKIFLNDVNVNYFISEDLMERFSKYYIADGGYDSKEIRENLISRDLIPIIKGNIRNTKDEEKIKQKKFNIYENKIYNKRFAIEGNYSHIKSFKLIQTRMDRKSVNFENSLFISYMNKVLRYI
jgi:hypothetical protein